MNRTPPPVFVLGGHQTDFARHWTREGKTIVDLMRETAEGAFEATKVEAREVQTLHVGNFTSELFVGQGHLNGFATSLHPDLDGVASARHEAACASGGLSVLAAMAELQAGHYDVALALGVEWMRNVPGETASQYVGCASWVGREALGAKHAWPNIFGQLADGYDERHGVAREHLVALAKANFAAARTNPNAQTRKWTLTDAHFEDADEMNPRIDGRLRRHDCSQITDGGAAVVLASEAFARTYAARRGLSLDALPRLLGFGHRTAPMALEDKFAASRGKAWTFPHLRGTLEDAWRRAGVSGPEALDGIELHDCFTITEYVALDHLGLAEHGKVGRLIEEGAFGPRGTFPVNPSGGLMGGGHPVGASGVRMVLDAYKQTTGTAGDAQIGGAKRFQTLNVGGSLTTLVSFVVGT